MGKWVSENLSPKQMITIIQRGRGANELAGESGYSVSVSAPLPDGFGMTVGSEFGTPFDTGGMNDIMSKLFAIGGMSQKAGIRMKKMYMNPEPTEISFEMDFFAWNDATTEVLIPVVTLMAMAVGRTLDYDGLKNKIGGIFNTVASNMNTFMGVDISGLSEGVTVSSDVEGGTSKVLDLLNIIQGPPTSEIRFGDFMVLPRAYITSVATNFSNTLDPNGVPLSCKCNVTATLEEAPVARDIEEIFGIKV